MYDKYKRRYRTPRADDRLRRQIAIEAARRLYPIIGPTEGSNTLREASEAEYYTAKRKAAAVLGHRIRPGDLPSDAEVREQVLALARSKEGPRPSYGPEPEEPGAVRLLADHVDRFTIYKMRLEPLAAIKQNPKYHPEGDALYHSLQVFGLAREARPYDEEFLLAALLHDVGKAIDPHDHVAAGLEALRGTITERTAWLIEHHMDLLAHRDRPLSLRARKALEESEYYEDLVLLRDLDDAGRVPGAQVDTIDQALAYLRGLEAEEYLDGSMSGH
ncbi:MAG: HD domain-containing protein [Isosphaeraceae bacterium]|nr:HD domain-containing protein [Isosphaeraceae bacterium]